MRGKQSDLLLRTGITITLSSNYPRSRAGVCISPLTDFPSPRCVNKSRSLLHSLPSVRESSRTFPSTSVLNWISPFILDCHAFDLLLHPLFFSPPSIFLPSVCRSQEHRRIGARQKKEKIELKAGSWRVTEGLGGASHSEAHTGAQKKQLIDSLVH